MCFARKPSGRLLPARLVLFGLDSAALMVASYLVAITIGTGLLMMPWATRSSGISFIDALFTATSALCVTGLTVVDTGSTFTTGGQLVILAAIQLGGLGNFGSWVGRTVFENGREVLAIDSDKDRVQKIKHYATVAVVADCTQKETLSKLGLAEMEAVLDYLPMTGQYEIVKLAPPDSFVGKTLQDLALPKRFHVQVIAVKQLIPEDLIIIPPVDFVVKDSDSLIVLGRTTNIERIRGR